MKFKSFWLYESYVNAVGVISCCNTVTYSVLPFRPQAFSGQVQQIVKIEMDLVTDSLEDAYATSEKFANEFVDFMAVSTFSRVELLTHLATTYCVAINDKFPLLASTGSTRNTYKNIWDLSQYKYAQSLTATGKSAIRLLRRALSCDVKEDAILFLYKSLETLAEGQSNARFSECTKCGNRVKVGKMTKQTIKDWLASLGADSSTVRLFVDKLRNTSAHGTVLKTAEQEDQISDVYSKIVSYVVTIVRRELAIDTVSTTSIITRRPYVIYNCMLQPESGHVLVVNYEFKGEAMRSTSGTIRWGQGRSDGVRPRNVAKFGHNTANVIQVS
jgi:hypothetical protein